MLSLLNRSLRVVLLFAASLPALAQFETASLTGIVTDAAGGVVPNASVKAVNEATNVEAMAATNAEGRYVFTALRPGSYKILAGQASSSLFPPVFCFK